MDAPRYHRILLKLSGEALGGPGGRGLDPGVLRQVAGEVRDITGAGVQVAIVVGGGNFIRGDEVAADLGIDLVSAHNMGILGTVINAIALQGVLEREGLVTRVQSAIEMHQIAEPFIRRRAIRHLEKGRVVIFAGGTGSPYFSTDTAAALRAIEVEAEAVLKGTQVEGVYDRDPELDAGAKLFRAIDYTEFLSKDLKVMDATAVALCRDNNVRIHVFDVSRPGNIRRVVFGEPVGTFVGREAG